MHFGGLRVTYIRTPFITRWKARGRRLPIGHNWTFFAISYGWNVISGNLSKLAFFEGAVTLSINFRRKGASLTNHCLCQKTQVVALSCMRYQNTCSASFSFVTSQCTLWRTDRQTDGQYYDSQNRASIATSAVKTGRLFQLSASRYELLWAIIKDFSIEPLVKICVRTYTHVCTCTVLLVYTVVHKCNSCQILIAVTQHVEISNFSGGRSIS